MRGRRYSSTVLSLFVSVVQLSSIELVQVSAWSSMPTAISHHIDRHHHNSSGSITSTALLSAGSHGSTQRGLTKVSTGFLLPLVLSSMIFSTAIPSPSWADAGVGDDAAATTAIASPKHSIDKCVPTAKASQCVSTSNVRQLDLYAAPWTFTASPDEVMSRLKGAVVYDTASSIIEQDGSEYLVVEAKRDLFGNTDRIEFVINGQDNVVTFSSKTTADSDFGYQQRRRLDDIRKRAGIFGVMGEALKSADTATTGERGNGPLGQLKAFYGLQSGSGFEDVLAE